MKQSSVPNSGDACYWLLQASKRLLISTQPEPRFSSVCGVMNWKLAFPLAIFVMEPVSRGQGCRSRGYCTKPSAPDGYE